MAASIALAVVVLTASTARAQSWPDLHGDLPAQGGGAHDAALVVGVSDYVYLPRIEGANDNATAWQEWLVRVRKVPGERVVLLRDREATKEKIERNLRTLTTQVGPQGTIWFVFIGHGAPSPSGDDGLLLGPDTDSDADSLAARGVPQRTVLDALEKSSATNAVALFDACFSGMTNDGQAPLVKGLQATLPVRRTGPPAKTAVLASSETFAGPLPGGQPGNAKPAFSYLVLGALRGWGDANADGAVTLDEAFALARATMQTGFKSDARLPSKRGPSPTLAMNAKEPRPDLDAILVGRCPSGSTWSGRSCVSDAPMICPAGARWTGSACVSECPVGTSWNGKGCAVARVLCPDGSEWDGAACVAQQPAVAVLAPATSVRAIDKVRDDDDARALEEERARVAMATPGGAPSDAPIAPVASAPVASAQAVVDGKPALWVSIAAPAGGALAGGLAAGIPVGLLLAEEGNDVKDAVGSILFGSVRDSTDSDNRRGKAGYAITHTSIAVVGAAGGAAAALAIGSEPSQAAIVGGVALAAGLITVLPAASVYDDDDVEVVVAVGTLSALTLMSAAGITNAALTHWIE